MVTTRFMELRKRRGLMIALIAVNIGIPVVFLGVRLISHAVAPKSYGPAGGYSIFTTLVAGFMYVFGFVVAAVVGFTAGSVDLTEGMFRHLVITGRSRLALYFARIPAGLAIVITMVAVGYTIVSAVCVFAAPTQLNYDGVNVPGGCRVRPSTAGRPPRQPGHLQLQLLRGRRAQQPPPNVPCGNGQTRRSPTRDGDPCEGRGDDHRARQRIASPDSGVRGIGRQPDYANYHTNFLAPSTTLMVDVGLWIALEATIGFIVGLGLASLMGQRTVPVILLIVLELILTPLFTRHIISHLLNVQRGIVGVAMAHIKPGSLPTPFSGGGGGGGPGGEPADPQSRPLASSLVIVGWIVFWTAIGAWRMMTRDA